MRGTSKLIGSVLIFIPLLLLASACSKADWPGTWADEQAEGVCRIMWGTPDSIVLDVDGEIVLVVNATWPDDDDAKLGAMRVSGADVVSGLDPATGATPDKVLCLSTRSADSSECPDGSVIGASPQQLDATLHSIALESEIGETGVVITAPCRVDGPQDEASLASATPRNERTPDAYDIDQVFCNLFTCLINDDTSTELTTFRAGDPRAAVCGFTESFVDGVVELEDGLVYVAHELGYRDAFADTVSARNVETDRTVCIEASSGSALVSCGEYQLEGQSFGGVKVDKTSVEVEARWFDGDGAQPVAASADFYSECREEITVQTSGYGSTSLGLSGRDDRVHPSGMTAEHLTWMIEEVQQWAEVEAVAADLSSADCAALSQASESKSVLRRLDSYADGTDWLTLDRPAGLSDDLETLQALSSDMFESVIDDSVLFDPVFELWYIAHFNWPLIDTWVSDVEGDMSSDDAQLALMGMPARIGQVSIVEPAFATRHETANRLADIYRDHC